MKPDNGERNNETKTPYEALSSGWQPQASARVDTMINRQSTRLPLKTHHLIHTKRKRSFGWVFNDLAGFGSATEFNYFAKLLYLCV
jgi:hypothetical protein